MEVFICPAAWLLIIAIAGVSFQRRGYGSDPALAAVLMIIPGLGYAYLGAWTRLAVAFVPVLMGGSFFFSIAGLQSIQSVFIYLFWGGIVVDAFLAGKAKRKLEVHSAPPDSPDNHAPSAEGRFE
jgi:hypothetical protein